MADDLIAEVFDSWWPTVAVLQMVEKHLVGRDASISAISPYLRDGLIRTGAARCSSEGLDDPPEGIIEIEKAIWRSIDDLTEEWDFWRSGTLIVDYEGDQMTFFGVRFDPNGVAGLMAAIAPSEPAALESPNHDVESPEDRQKTPVSPAALQAWAEVFNKYYPGASLKEAWKSAKGMFFDKRVSRERVDALLPKRERGRRPDRTGN